MRNIYLILFLFIAGLINTGSSCKLSMSGASIPPEIESVTINYFPNQSPFVATSLSQIFTETLIDKFNRESNLTVKDTGGDWEFNGAVTNYTSTPIAPTGNETTALNRLTIVVKVEFTDLKDETRNWTQSFSRFSDYESTQVLSQVENDLIQEISEQLADDIFLNVAGNW
ncbi:MAG: LptE family protein [Fimbriimonadaceae bacterium]|nr:LptE family protein [Chitinophagales bacterium]